jgi:hypothetical protein
MTTTIEQLKVKIELFSKLLTLLATLTGGGFALFQYIDNANAERVKETLFFVEKFDKDNFLKSRSKINSFFKNIESELYEKVSNETEYSNFITEQIKDNSFIEDDLELVFDFYDELYVCVSNVLCDQKVALEYFGKYAYDIIGVGSPYVKNIKEKSHDRFYGSGIMFFFKEYKEKLKSNPV